MKKNTENTKNIIKSRSVADNIIVDMHAHLLPGIDDGSADVSQSIAILRMEQEQDVSAIIVTPHFYAGKNSPNDFISMRDESVKKLLLAAKGIKDIPKLALGAEVHFFDGISCCSDLYKLKITGTDYVLLEMPMTLWSKRILSEVKNISIERGIIPIIAHIDRYLLSQPAEIISELLHSNVLIQANAASFYSRKMGKTVIKMLCDGVVHFIGSDCHDTKDRPPNIKKALDKIHLKANDKIVKTWIAHSCSLLQSLEYIDFFGDAT